MSRELDVIKRDLDYERCVKTVKKEPNCCLAPRVNAIDIIAKREKALEIIKRLKLIDKHLLLDMFNMNDITQEEYELLKEVLL